MSLNEDHGFGSRIFFPGGGGGGGGADPLAYQKQAALQMGQNRQQSRQQGAQNDLQRYLADQASGDNRYGIDTQAETARRGQQLQYDASVLPANQKMQRFGTLLPMMSGAFNQIGQMPQGPVGRAPAITTGGVWDQGQIQQQVNAGRASNDRQTAGQVQKMHADVAGRGFGANSPLAMALETNYKGQGMAANANTERETRMGAAEKNAGHLLATQSAAEGQYASRQQEEIQRRKARMDALTQWTSTLGSMV